MRYDRLFHSLAWNASSRNIETEAATGPHVTGGSFSDGTITFSGTAGFSNFNVTGIDTGGSSPLTTKGDIYVYSDSGTRLPVGTDSYVLSADSSEDTGLKWVAASTANYYLSALTWDPTNTRYTGSMGGGGTTVTGGALTNFGQSIALSGTNAGHIDLYEAAAGGSSYIKLQAPAALGGGKIFTLPDDYPASSGYALVSTDAGVMSWAANDDANYYVTGGTYSAGEIDFSGTTSFPDFTVTGLPTGTIGGSIAEDRIAVGTATANTITGTSRFEWDDATLTMINTGNTAITLLGDANRSNADAHAMAMRGKWDGTTIGTVMIATGPDDTNKDDGQILFYTASAGTQTERMRIDETGNIGIGTSAPNDKLDVRGNMQFSGSLYVSGNALGGYISKFGTASDGAMALYAGAGQRGVLLDANINYLDAGTRWQANSTFRISGTEQLQFGDDEHYIYSDGTDLILKTVTTATNGIVVDSKVDTTMKIDGTTKGTWTSTGLGIGTTSPAEYLEINSSADDDPAFKLYNSRSPSASGALILQHRGSTINQISTGSAATPFRWTVQSTEMMRLDDTGLGIGTTAPAKKLHVEGGVAVSGAEFSGDTGYGHSIYTYNQSGAQTLRIYSDSRGVSGGKRQYISASARLNIESTEHMGIGANTSGEYLQLYSGPTASMYIDCGGDFQFRDKDDSSAVRMRLASADGALGVSGLITASGGATIASSQNFTMGGNAVNDILIDGDSYPGSSQDDYLITAKYLNTVSGAIVAAGGGGTIGGSITDNQIAFGATTANSIEGSSNLTFDGNHMTLAAGKHIYFNDTDASIHAGADSRLDVKGDSVTFASGSTEVMRVNGGGVGIFTSSPSEALHVEGSILADPSTGSDTAGTSAGIKFTVQDDADVGWNLRLGDTSDDCDFNIDRLYSSAWYKSASIDRTTGDFIWYDDDGSTAKMLWDASANRLGIGTTSPSYELDVNGDANVSSTLYLGDTDTKLFRSSNDLYIRAHTDIALNDTGGSVGIGTAAPAEKLSVVGGNILIGSNNQYLQFVNAAGTQFDAIGYDGSNDLIFNSPSDTIFKRNGTEKMRLSASDLLGIGTASPEGILHTANNSGVNIFQRSNDSASYGTNFYIRKSRGTVGSESNTQSGDLIGQIGFSPYYGDYDNYAASISAKVTGTLGTDTTPGYLAFSTAAAGANTVTQRMAINESGQVGIGTASPSYALDVYEDTSSEVARFKNTSSNGYVMRLDAGDGSYMRFQTDHIIPNYSLHLMNDNANLYVRTAGYKFGVGTGSPKTSMSLVGALSIEERADHETTTTGWGQLWIKNSTPNKIYFTDDAGTDFDLTATGTAATPGGSTTQLQYNNGGAFGGIDDWTWDGTDMTVATGSALVFGDSLRYIEESGDHLYIRNSETGGNIELNAKSNVKWSIDGALKMYLDGDNLTLNGDSTAFSIKDADGTETARLATASGDQGLLYLRGPTGGNAIYLDGNGASYMDGGYIGFGTTSPDNSAEMTIVGKVYQQVDSNGNTNYGSGSFAHGSGLGNYTGYYSSIIGIEAGHYISGNAHRNVAVGYRAMYGATTGQQSSDNTAIGASALYDLGAGNFNVAVGSSAGGDITGGEHNIYVGYVAGRETTIGHKNIGIGSESLYNNIHGDYNIGIGSGTLYYTAPSDGEGKNIAIGTNAGAQNTTGTGNIFIGDQAGNDTTWQTLDDKLVIANSATTSPLIYGDFSAGTVTINGTISATAKSFNIEHPLYKDKRLVHGSLEGPEHGIYIRGTIESKEYGCLIELPEYWEAMCEDYTVQLTPHGPYTVYIKEKHKDKVMIACTSKDYKFDYYVVGSRTDETLEVVQDA